MRMRQLEVYPPTRRRKLSSRKPDRMNAAHVSNDKNNDPDLQDPLDFTVTEVTPPLVPEHDDSQHQYHTSEDDATVVDDHILEDATLQYPKRRLQPLSFKHAILHRYDPDSRSQTPQQVPVLALRRKTTFFGLVWAVAQFAMVDTFQFLPVGILTYIMGFNMLLELLRTPEDVLSKGQSPYFYSKWSVPNDDDNPTYFFRWIHSFLWQDDNEYYYSEWELFQRELQMQREHFQKEYQQVEELVAFAVGVLQGRPPSKVPDIVVREENGNVLYHTE